MHRDASNLFLWDWETCCFFMQCLVVTCALHMRIATTRSPAAAIIAYADMATRETVTLEVATQDVRFSSFFIFYLSQFSFWTYFSSDFPQLMLNPKLQRLPPQSLWSQSCSLNVVKPVWSCTSYVNILLLKVNTCLPNNYGNQNWKSQLAITWLPSFFCQP